MNKSFAQSALPLLLILSACSPKSDGNGSGDALNIPEHLEKMSAESTPLTESQLKEAKTVMKTTSKLPDATLFWQEKGETQTDIAKKKKAYSKLDSDGKELFAEIKQKCTIQDPQQTQNPENTMPAPGAVITQIIRSAIGGENCPIRTKKKQDRILTWKQYDQKSGDGLVVVDETSTQVSDVLSDKVSSMTDLIGSQFNTKMNTVVRLNGGKQEVFGTVMLSQDAMTNSIGALKLSGTAKVLTKILPSGGVRKELSYLLKLKMPSSEIVINIFKSREGGGAEQGTYTLNSRVVTLEELQEVTGPGFDPNLD